MRVMKKLALIILILSLLVGLLTGCKGKAGEIDPALVGTWIRDCFNYRLTLEDDGSGVFRNHNITAIHVRFDWSTREDGLLTTITSNDNAYIEEWNYYINGNTLTKTNQQTNMIWSFSRVRDDADLLRSWISSDGSQYMRFNNRHRGVIDDAHIIWLATTDGRLIIHVRLYVPTEWEYTITEGVLTITRLDQGDVSSILEILERAPGSESIFGDTFFGDTFPEWFLEPGATFYLYLRAE